MTTGTVALVFFSAFEALAVTTAMPVVSADLDGEALYALAFAGTLATGIIGMVAAGTWSDRRGPVAPLYAAVTVARAAGASAAAPRVTASASPSTRLTRDVQ